MLRWSRQLDFLDLVKSCKHSASYVFSSDKLIYRLSVEHSNFMLQRLSVKDPVCKMKIVIFQNEIKVFPRFTCSQCPVQRPVENSFFFPFFIFDPEIYLEDRCYLMLL